MKFIIKLPWFDVLNEIPVWTGAFAAAKDRLSGWGGASICGEGDVSIWGGGGGTIAVPMDAAFTILLTALFSCSTLMVASVSLMAAPLFQYLKIRWKPTLLLGLFVSVFCGKQ